MLPGEVHNQYFFVISMQLSKFLISPEQKFSFIKSLIFLKPVDKLSKQITFAPNSNNF